MTSQCDSISKVCVDYVKAGGTASRQNVVVYKNGMPNLTESYAVPEPLLIERDPFPKYPITTSALLEQGMAEVAHGRLNDGFPDDWL